MDLEQHDHIALLRMDSGRGNAINADMLARLDAALQEFEADAAHALVITGTGRTFCAGLDLPGLAALNRDGVRHVLDTMHRVFLRIFRMSRPVVAAVNGHAIAGGCVLVQQADVRIQARGGFKVGLNETQLGVGLPSVVVETLRFHAPGSFVPAALEGRLFDVDGALRQGLVDELAGDAEARALERAAELAAVPAAAYAQVKAALRAPFVERAELEHDDALEWWLDTWESPAAQKRIGEVVAKLGSA